MPESSVFKKKASFWYLEFRWLGECGLEMAGKPGSLRALNPSAPHMGEILVGHRKQMRAPYRPPHVLFDFFF